MLATIYNSSIESYNAKQLLGHLLQKMDFDKYNSFLWRAKKYPKSDHRFVMFEYVESPSDSLIARSERIPHSKTSIHEVITHPDFQQHMVRLFVNSENVNWYTRRKMDYTKPFGMDQVTDIRQLVLVIYGQVDDIPPLIPAEPVTAVFNPEDAMPPLVSLGNQSPIALNQTIWNPEPHRFNYLSPNINWLP